MILRIECPQCNEGFEVSDELRGRTVECGSCEHRFQVNDEVMAGSKDRFYPDENRKDVDLSRFGRAPATSAPVEFRSMKPDNGAAGRDFVGPIPPIRLFSTVVGLGLLIACSLFLYLGSRPGSSLLKDVEKLDRYSIAGFFGVVGLWLLSWGMIRNRIFAILLGLLGLGGLLALAHYMPVHRSPKYVSDWDSNRQRLSENDGEQIPTTFGEAEEPLTLQEVAKWTRWKSSVAPVMASEGDGNVVAIWVREMEEYRSLEIRNYIQQELGLDGRPYFRTLSGKEREGGLFIVSGIPIDLDRVELVVSGFGAVEQTLPELRVVQARLSREVLGGEVSNEANAKLVDSNNGAFYSGNYEELLSLDKGRVEDAVKRLAGAPPIKLRKDITVRLVGLMRDGGDLALLGHLSEAVSVWSEENDGADIALLNLAIKRRAAGQAVPEEMLSFFAKRKTAGAETLLIDLWSQDASGRQRFLESYGSQIATLLPPYLSSENVALARSAVLVLGQVGTQAELPAMKKALSTSKDSSFKLSLEQAIGQIERR